MAAAVGGMVSTGLGVVLGMPAVVHGPGEGRGVGWLGGVLLGARGRAPGGDGSALLTLSPDVATGPDVGGAPGPAASAGGRESERRARPGHQPRVRPSRSALRWWVGPYPGTGQGSGWRCPSPGGRRWSSAGTRCRRSPRPTHRPGHRARLLGGGPSPPHRPPHAPAFTLVALASGQVDVGHTQCAEPASSTQDAPNSQRISAHVSGAKESGADMADPAGSRGLTPMTAPPLARGAKVPARLGSHLFHSLRGPGRGLLDTARTWARLPQAYMSTARSSAHSRPAPRPGGHSCRLGGRGKNLSSAPGLPTGSRARPSSCLVCVRPGSEQVRRGAGDKMDRCECSAGD